MSRTADAWFWLPDCRTGIAYREGNAEERSHVLCVDELSRDSLLVQCALPGSSLICFDVPAASDNEQYEFSGRSDNARKFTPLLAPEPADLPGVLAVAPDGWNVATVAWLTADESRPLQVRRLVRSRVSNPKFITAADVQAPISELADATLCFADDDGVGPAFSPGLASETSHVLVTFPAVPSETHLDIQVQLVSSVQVPVPVQLLFRDPQKRRVIAPVEISVLTPQSSRRNFSVGRQDILLKLEVYIQAPEGVRLSFRDGNGLQTEVTGSPIARRLVRDAFEPVDFDRLTDSNLKILRDNLQRLSLSARQAAEAGLDASGNPGRAGVRQELARRYGILPLFDEGVTAVSLHDMPAPLFAALIEHVVHETNKVDAARRFLRWPAAAQLQRSTRYSFEFDHPRPDKVQAATVIWQQAGVAEEAFRWLTADPERQIRILPLISPAIDVPRLLESVRKVRNLEAGNLEAVARDLIEIETPDWMRLFGLTLPHGALHQQGRKLLGERAPPLTQDQEIHLRCRELKQYEDAIRSYLGRLAGARRRFAAYSSEIAGAIERFDRSRRDGLAALEALATKYVKAGERLDGEQGIANLVRDLENGVAAEFSFDLHFLCTEAAGRWAQRKQQAQLVHWIGDVVRLLSRETAPTEVPGWPDNSSADDLATDVGRIRHVLSGHPGDPAKGKITDLAQPLQVRAESLRSAVEAALERCSQLVALAHVDDLDIGVLVRRVELAADKIVFECLRNDLCRRQRVLLQRHQHIARMAGENLARLMEQALPEHNATAGAASVNEWWSVLGRIEQGITEIEIRVSELKGLPREVQEILLSPGSPESDARANALIANWKIEAEVASQRLARARACAIALGAQADAPSIEPELPSESFDRDTKDRVLAWNKHCRQRLATLDELRASLAGTVLATLRQQCPTVPWGEDAGDRIAEVLVNSSESHATETSASLARVLGLVQSIWEVTGGDSQDHVRDLLWLRREEPVVRGFETVLEAVENPERLVGDASFLKLVEEVDALKSQACTRDFSTFRDHVGKAALSRWIRLARDPAADRERILRAIPGEISKVANPSRAITAVRSAVDFARNSGARDSDAAALRSLLERHALMPERQA